jgi:hypothetical protein
MFLRLKDFTASNEALWILRYLICEKVSDLITLLNEKEYKKFG